jgi:hypothetical protein
MAKSKITYILREPSVKNGGTSACVDMVLRAHGIEIPQIEIAKEIGAPYFPPKRRDDETGIQRFLREKKLPLTEAYTHFDEVQDHDNSFLICTAINDKSDVVMHYDLSGSRGKRSNKGSSVLIYSCDDPNLVVLDPVNGRVGLNLNNLRDFIAGFSVFSLKSRN